MGPPEQRASVLLVDDQPANLLALEVVLGDLGHGLVRARSGEEALRLLAEQEFAVVLLDVQMPTLDGFETAKRMRAGEKGRHTPVIFLTAYGDDRFPIDKAYALGAVDYLVKPIVPIILRAKVSGFVELFQKTEQLLAMEQREHDRRKDEFLAVLAHELRNPLAPIRNAAQLIGLAAPSDPVLKQAGEVIERQVRHLARLVDDLLDVSRIARGKVSLDTTMVELSRLARVAAEDFRPAFDAAGVALAFHPPDEPAWVEGDPTRLTQVLGNLLQNALKFTPRGGRAAVRVEAAEGWVAVRVSDTGVGIDAGLLPRLFEEFSQADRSLERSQGGLGLGLSVAKGLAGLHGGEVSASSGGPGQGSEFTVRLPRRPEPAAAEAVTPAPAPAPAARRLRVLVVEDNVDSARSLRLLLEVFGHEPAVAHTGPEGVEAAYAWGPEVVLCDIGLPGMSGYEVAARLRRDPRTASARLVALTGYGQDKDRRKAREAGFDLHLTKPVEPATLRDLLAEHAAA